MSSSQFMTDICIVVVKRPYMTSPDKMLDGSNGQHDGEVGTDDL